MTSSTIVIKKPQSVEPDVYPPTKQIVNNGGVSTLVFVCLWAFSALFAAAKAEISSNANGLSISFTMQDVSLLIFTSWLLYKGLSTGTVMLAAPWVFINTYSIYYGHYHSILRMINLLHHIKIHHALPWTALFFNSFALLVRVVLLLRILQLTANIWYKTKLEKELYQTL